MILPQFKRLSPPGRRLPSLHRLVAFPLVEKSPLRRYPEKPDYSQRAECAVAFRCLLHQVGAMARDPMRERTSAKSDPGTATSAIWNTVLLA